jgi:alkyl hydroperoxide reductase subunit AhpC
MYKVGDKFCYFKTKAYHNKEIKEVNLEDYKGKWLIIVSHPAAFTGVCQNELIELAKDQDEYKKLGAQLFSVSTDSVYTLKAWVENTPEMSSIDFPMLSDSNHSITCKLGTYDENTGLSRRGTIIVNPEGVVIHISINDYFVGRNTKEILRTFKACKYVYDNPGKVCMPNWDQELVK